MISLNHVTREYQNGKTPVLAIQDISLTVKRGEFVSIVGTSGSGKTTLMNILGCLDTPSKGSYTLDGESITSLPKRLLPRIRNRKIGFVFQSFHLLPRLTALENVEMPLLFRGLPAEHRRALAEGALRSVGLSDRVSHKPFQLSGGQQQRVAIARAIVTGPSMVLADEPTGNLDSKSGADVLELLLELNRKGATIVLITHDDAVAARAGRTLRILDGRLG
ncbi:ABC transporter ATP-binding protein [Oscillospiraceae bacterium OttesenSCG-928-G22]|nr:ABC transporter ATP-binding protein [Oscillospiraceae bacterium OttesenSCG-928-G22]